MKRKNKNNYNLKKQNKNGNCIRTVQFDKENKVIAT